MSEGPDEKDARRRDVVDELLDELGVDDDLKQELIDSGRMHTDRFMVESAEQVRRRMEIESSAERLRDSLLLLERNLSTVDNTVDRVERDLVPVVLSFLVGLKGNLVNLKTNVIGRSKRRAKTNLQAAYVDTEVRAIVEEEFAKIEETLTTGMSAPIMDKMRDIVEGMRSNVKTTYGELTTLKSAVDDFTQRATTEVEFLAKELIMKPKEEVPESLKKQLRDLERGKEEAERELGVAEERLANREEKIESLQKEVAQYKVRAETLDEQITSMKATPTVDASVVAELRQNVTSLEAARDILAQKVQDAEDRADDAETRATSHKEAIAHKEIEVADLTKKVQHLESESGKAREALKEIDDLKAKLRSYESGDKLRELERITAELERTNATLKRMNADYATMKENLEYTQKRLEGYLGLMEAKEKTKGFLMVEEATTLTLREIARSLGVAPGTVSKWAEDYQKLGIVKVLPDGQTLELAEKDPSKKTE
jgi:DNA repair exonuclease SbcCD ATPase subunit